MRSIKVTQTVFTPSRSLEWHCALSAAAFAVILAFPGNTFSTAEHWQRFREVMSEEAWALCIGAVAAIRISALLINGHWRRTPLLRALTAIGGAGVWAYMAMLFYAPDADGLATGIGIFGMLAVSDVKSAVLAGRDIEVARRVAEMMNAAPPAPMPRGFAP